MNIHLDKMTSRLAVLVMLLAGIATYNCSFAAGDLPGKGVSVTAGYTVGLLEERFQNQVVDLALERLGYHIKDMVQLDVPALHIAVAQDDVQFMAAHWDPLQEAFYKRAGGPKTVEMVGKLVKGCLQGYLVDMVSYKKYGVHNIAQLRNPKIAKLFDDDGDGKADLAGCPPGWGCERVVDHQLDAYKLRKTVTHHQGQFDVMAADTVSRFRAGQRVVYYTYTPFWLSQILVPGRDVQWLSVPFTSLPAEQAKLHLNTKLPDGRNVGWPVNTMRIMANRKFLEANPAAKRLFQLMVIPVQDVTAENWLLHEGQTSYADVRRHAEDWIHKHQKEFDGWIHAALKAAKS